MTLQEFWIAFDEYRFDNMANQRQGQALFNFLNEHRPELAHRIRGTIQDPFYQDERISSCVQFINNNWDKS